MSVVQLIASHNHSSKNASYTVKTIDDIKKALNAQYSGVYYSDYYRNETNPYIQNGGLLNSLKNVFTNNKELQVVMTDDYTNVLKSSKLNSRTAKKSNHKLSKNTKDLLKDDKQYDKEYEKKRQPTSNKEIKKLELKIAEDNINRYGLSVKPEKFVRIQNKILKKLKNNPKYKNVDECNLNGKAIELTVKRIQNQAEPKQHKHGFGNYVDTNTGKSIDTQDNKRDANELKNNTPKKSSSKQSNNKSNINTQSDTKMSDSSTHAKNKDTAVGRKSRLSELRNEYNQIATKKFKESYSKMVNGTATDAERKFCINKSKRLNPIHDEIQSIKRKIKKDKANAIPNTADNSNDSSDEDLPF